MITNILNLQKERATRRQPVELVEKVDRLTNPYSKVYHGFLKQRQPFNPLSLRNGEWGAWSAELKGTAKHRPRITRIGLATINVVDKPLPMAKSLHACSGVLFCLN